MSLYKTNTVGGGSSSQNNKKKKLLLKILLPISLLIVFLSIFLGCWFGCNRTTFIFKNDKSVTDYLEKHKSVHKGEQHFDYNDWTHDNRQWLRSNLNGQNLLNGIMTTNFLYKEINKLLVNSKWEIKHGKNWASLKSIDDSLDKIGVATYQYWDRYIYEKTTDKGIDTTIKWMTKHDVSDPNEEMFWEELTLHCQYLNDSAAISTTTITPPHTTDVYDNVCGTIHFVYDVDYQADLFRMNQQGAFGLPYPFLSLLDYPNIDVVNQ